MFPQCLLFCPSVPPSTTPFSLCPFPSVTPSLSLLSEPSSTSVPLSPGGAPDRFWGLHSFSPLVQTGTPFGQQSCFLSSSRPRTPPSPGPQPTPPLLRACPAPRVEPPGLQGGGAPRGSQKLLCKEAGQGTEQGLRPSRRRGVSGVAQDPSATTRYPLPTAYRVRAYLGARCPPPAARARPGPAAHTSASARPLRPCSLRPSRAGSGEERGTGVPPTGRSVSAPHCWFLHHRWGSQPPSRHR